MNDNSRAHAVIFDLDGTLVDSEPLYHEATRSLLAEYGIAYTWADHSESIGIGTRETLQSLRERYSLEADVDDLLAALNRRFLDRAGRSAAVFPRMAELVARLAGAGIPMAVASGSSGAAIEALLRGAGLRDLLTVTVSAEEVAAGKPAPDVFLEAARRLGADPARCLVVEDAAPGVEAAFRAGMGCLAVPTADADATAFASADLVIPPGGSSDVTVDAAFRWITSWLTGTGSRT